MQTVSNQNFGLVIAYLVPGVTALGGISLLSETVRGWLGATPAAAPTVSGFLYATVVAIGLGVLLNTVRLFTLDQMLHATGIHKPEWDYRTLQDNIAAIEFIILNQFRFHQFHGNTAIALLVSYAMFEARNPNMDYFITTSFLGIELFLLLGARRCLGNYYQRLNAILGQSQGELTRSNWTSSGKIDRLQSRQGRATVLVFRSSSNLFH